MKLAAIYNVWDGVELLRGSMLRIKDEVDYFIIVHQKISNYGEEYNPLSDVDLSDFDNVIFYEFSPYLSFSAAKNETLKRNEGLTIAKLRTDATHFLHLDCDEYYQDFKSAKQQFINSGAKGSVCKMLTYFKTPTLRLENPDNYYVPFIHQLNADTEAGRDQYPFYVDPTRRINETDIILLDEFMHHFSWIRKDIERKVRNSSAKSNIERSKLLHDYYSEETKAGCFLEDYNQKLVEVDDLFGIGDSSFNNLL